MAFLKKEILTYDRKAFQKLMVFLKKQILRYDRRMFCIYMYMRYRIKMLC